MLNDTRFNALTLFIHEVLALGYNPNLHTIFPVRIDTANGYVDRVTILVELWVRQNNGQALTGLFVEDATIVPFTGTEVPLSGDSVRRELFFFFLLHPRWNQISSLQLVRKRIYVPNCVAPDSPPFHTTHDESHILQLLVFYFRVFGNKGVDISHTSTGILLKSGNGC